MEAFVIRIDTDSTSFERSRLPEMESLKESFERLSAALHELYEQLVEACQLIRVSLELAAVRMQRQLLEVRELSLMTDQTLMEGAVYPVALSEPAAPKRFKLPKIAEDGFFTKPLTRDQALAIFAILVTVVLEIFF